MTSSLFVRASGRFVSALSVNRLRFVGLLAFCLGASGVVEAKVNLGEGPDRRLLLVGELLGMESPQRFEETAGGGVAVTYETGRTVFDAAGEKVVELGAEEAYAAATDVWVDLSVKGEVSARRGTTGELLNRYAFPENDARAYEVFFTDEGQVCHAVIGGGKVVSFDPVTGEVLWVKESDYSWAPVGSGPLVARYTILFSVPEAPVPSWPVEETLYDSRTGERLFAEDGNVGDGLNPVEDGVPNAWLYRGPFASRQAIYVTDQIRALDAEGELSASLSLDGGRVMRPLLAPSSGGGTMAALVGFFDGEGVTGFRLGVWNMDTEDVVWIDWNGSWGDVSTLQGLAVADSGEFLMLSLLDSGILMVDTETGEGESFFESGERISESLAILQEDGLLLALDDEGSLRVVEVDTGEEVFARTVSNRGDEEARPGLKHWRLSEDGAVLFLGTDERVWRLDLGTLEAEALAPAESARVTAVLPANGEGLATVLFADGTARDLDVVTGEAVGARQTVAPAHDGVLTNDFDEQLAVLDDGRIVDLDTGELRFDFQSLLDRDDLEEGQRSIVARLAASDSLGAKIMESGRRVAFFDGECAAVFSLIADLVIDARARSWLELVEGESFLVALESVPETEDEWDRRLAVYDLWTYEELYRLAIPQGVKVSPDGRHFAWVEESVESVGEGTDEYEWLFRLRQFEMQPMGFREIEAREWAQVFPAGEGPQYGTPKLLRYEGPEGVALALVGRERILEFSSGDYAEWERPDYRDGRGTQVVQRTEAGRLLLRDELNRVGLYGYFVPVERSVDLTLSKDGKVEPELSGYSVDRIDVWRSSDLVNWELWDGRPVVVDVESPIFFRVIEWIAEWDVFWGKKGRFALR